LIQLDTVLAGFRGKAGAAGVLQTDFQKRLPGANLNRMQTGGQLKFPGIAGFWQ
jgi:hypothetical protein